MPENVRMRPGDPHTRFLREPQQPPGGGVPVHAGSAAVEQDRPAYPGARGAVDGPPDSRGRRDQDNLRSLAAHPQDPVAVFFTEITYIRAGGFEDPQAQEAEHGHQCEVVPVS